MHKVVCGTATSGAIPQKVGSRALRQDVCAHSHSRDTHQPHRGHGRAEPYALTPNTVELILTLGAIFPRGGPVQDPVLTARGNALSWIAVSVE